MEFKGMKPTVLIVEDEAPIITMLTYNLEKEGFKVVSTEDGDDATWMIEEYDPDIILLDWMLPSVSGIDICRSIRNNPKSANIPVIMLSAKGEESDRVMGLDTGADDYLTKPFSPAELIARINAMFRRLRPAFTEEKLVFCGVEVDLAQRKVMRDGVELHMGPTEFRILHCLIEHPDRVYSRQQLITHVWGIENDYIEPRTVDVHINRLRNALKHKEGADNLIRTVRSAGYCIHNPDGD